MRPREEMENLGNSPSHRKTPITHKENNKKNDRKIQETTKKWAAKDQRESEEAYLGDERIPVNKIF
jgi:hypothetical protein